MSFLGAASGFVPFVEPQAMLDHPDGPELVPTGVPGLDDVLFGGLPRRGIYAVGGQPGTGKTTLGLQFLTEGARRGERTLFVTLSQDRRDLERIARSHRFDMTSIQVEEVSVLKLARAACERQSVLQTADVELSEVMSALHDTIREARADRIVFDSLFEIRLLASDPLAYRRELLVLRELVLATDATGLFIDYDDETLGDRQLEGLSTGAIMLETRTPSFGAAIRRLHVAKLRGRDFVGGHHDMTIRRGGIAVFPRVVPELTPETLTREPVSCGIDALDEMLGGGLPPGTTCMITGQSGTGKSTLATAYAQAAAANGSRAAMFLFEERPEVLRRRSRDLGFRLSELETEGTLSLAHFNPAEVSPGQFASAVVEAVEEQGARVVVIDSLSGFLGALQNGQDLVMQLHSLLAYLSRRDVLTILTLTQHGLLGGDERMPVDASYLADSAILLRLREAGSDVRRSIVVLKKRHGDHEHAVRELVIGGRSVSVEARPAEGAPLLTIH